MGKPPDVEVLTIYLPDGTSLYVRVEIEGEQVKISMDDYQKILSVLMVVRGE